MGNPVPPVLFLAHGPPMLALDDPAPGPPARARQALSRLASAWLEAAPDPQRSLDHGA